MNHLIDKLDDVDGMLDRAGCLLSDDQFVTTDRLRQARQTLQMTTGRLRAEWQEVVATGEATIAMLEKLRDHDLLELEVGILKRRDVTRNITEIIGWLDGSLPGEGEDESE